MEYLPVKTKRDFTRRFRAGEFGNRGPVWDSLAEYLDSGYQEGPIHLRNRRAGGPTYYDVPPESVVGMHKKATENGDSFYIAAMAPTAKTLIQGEVTRSSKGLYLLYSTVAKPMRDALAASSQQTYGIISSLLLRHYLCPTSYDWLEVLLDRYPGHVVEFSTYGVCWGVIPNMNTVFWEVRSY